jgi:hypothetical protein
VIHRTRRRAAAIDAAVASRSLRPDQRRAFDHGGRRRWVIEGRAETGKSYSLAAVRDAYEQPRRRI